MTLGIAAMSVVHSILELLPSAAFFHAYEPGRFFYFQALPALVGCAYSGLIAFTGALVARIRFLIPVVLYFCVTNSLSIYLLVELTKTFEPTGYLELAARNSVGSALGLIAVVVSVELGTMISNRKSVNLEATGSLSVNSHER